MSCWCVVADEAELKVPQVLATDIADVVKEADVERSEVSTNVGSERSKESVPSALREPTPSTARSASAKVGEKEAPSIGSFEIMLRTKGKKLGLEVDGCFTTPNNGVVVKEIKAGAIKDFNDKHPKQAIQIYDELTSLDDATGAKELGRAIGDKYLPDILTVTLVRPRKIQVTLVKPGVLGMNLDSKAQSVVVVKDVLQMGLVADWNAQHPEDALQPGDRIVENNGKFFTGDKMMKQLKSESTLKLTVLRYE